MKIDRSSLQLLIELRNPDELRPDPRNSKVHTAKQIKQVGRSITEFGWTNPILIDESDGVLAGHARLLAAKQLRLGEVPTIRIGHMSAAQKRAYIIADNKLAENAQWDRKMLALEHEAIQLLDPDFDLTISGFELEEINILFDNEIATRETPIPLVADGDAISRVCDLWQLGDHLLLCGDALESTSYERLMGGDRAQMVITDPPYNRQINGHVSSTRQHGEFVMASGEMTSGEFISFLSRAFGNLISFSCDGSIHYVFMDWGHMREILQAGAQYAEQKNLIVWDKGAAGLGSFYRSQHELVFAFKNGRRPHINNFKLGENGRHRSNVWSYPGLNGWSPGRKQQLAFHPTVKPVQMLADAMKDCSKKGGLVLDPFGGSGSTLIAAHQTGRRARLVELDPKYADVTIRRFQADTGQKAILCDDGRTFDMLSQGGR